MILASAHATVQADVNIEVVPVGNPEAEPQFGEAKAGADGLLTIEGCEFANEPRRLVVWR